MKITIRIRKIYLCALLACSVLFFLSSTAHAAKSNEDDSDKTLAPYFLVEGVSAENAGEASSVDCFPLKETNVVTNISGTIAETYVTQTYANTGEKPINASYLFPASTKVTVHGMKMQIGDQIVTAQIKEKEDAKQEFEEAKSEGKSASLLEEKRPNVFNMDVANIMPGDTVLIELHYTELISPVEGIYQFVFPTVVGPRYAEPEEAANTEENGWVETPYLENGSTSTGKYSITVNLATGVPITDLNSQSHDIKINWENNTSAKVTLENPRDFAGNRDFILNYKLTGSQVASGLVLTENNGENFFMLTVQPPERYTPEDILPREYVFVLDVSGSMSGYPMETAKILIKNLVSNLKETDKFNLILFSGASEQLSEKSLPATKENINLALDLINKQEGYGGTSLSPALESAIKIPSDEEFARSIVVITDGYISGEQNVFDLISKNLGTTSFFSFGIGTSVNRYLIEGMAQAGAGESFVVTESSEALEVAERFRTYINAPILTDIQVTYDGFDVYDVEPAALPTLFAQKPIVLFGKYRGEAAGTITITGKAGKQDYVQNILVSDIKTQSDNDAVRYLWARTRAERLMDYGYSKDNPEVKDEVTQLGLSYSMMTPYTSFVAVIDTIRNPEGESADVDQPLPLPLKVSNLAVGGGYRAYSEPADFFLILAGIGTLLVSILYRKHRHALK